LGKVYFLPVARQLAAELPTGVAGKAGRRSLGRSAGILIRVMLVADEI
jgi:hypothetical protein